MNSRGVAPVIVLSVIALARFADLGRGELLPWDECLYAVRARAVPQAFLDQTEHSVGGLYSSSHPPLAIWAMAACRAVFSSPLADRLPSAAAGVLLCVAAYAWTRRAFPDRSRWWGVLSAAAVGLSAPLFGYSRLAHVDVPVIALLAFALFLWARSTKRDSMRGSAAAGLVLGAALLTKIAVGLFALPVFALTAAAARNGGVRGKRILYHAILATAIAAVVALPWHLMMLARHGSEFISAYFLFHLKERVLSGVEGNLPFLGVGYFANQLLVAIPALAIAAFGLPRLLRAGIRGEADVDASAIASWFVVSFIAISLMRTKLASYLIVASVPASMLCVHELLRLSREGRRPATWAFLAAVVLACVGWWAFPEARAALRSFDLSSALPLVAVLALAAVVAVAFLFLAGRGTSVKRPVVVLLVCAIAVPSVVSAVDVVAHPAATPGMTAVAATMRDNEWRSLLMVGNKRNPQLAYYLDVDEEAESRTERFAHYEPRSDGYLFGRGRAYDWVLIERNDLPATDESELAARFGAGKRVATVTDGYILLGPAP